MFIVNDGKMKKSPIGAACPAFMTLLAELGNLLFFDIYRHAAPLGLKHSIILNSMGVRPGLPHKIHGLLAATIAACILLLSSTLFAQLDRTLPLSEQAEAGQALAEKWRDAAPAENAE